MDKLVCMRVFVNVVKLGSMAKAAEALNLTPPSISKTISKLEDDLGTQLLVRTTRKNYLTDEGHLYFESCERILSEIDETYSLLTDEHKVSQGVIKINAPVSFSQHVLYQAICDYQRQNQQVDFCLQCNDDKVNIVDSAFDLSIRITQCLDDSSARARLVSKTKLKLCASKAYIEKNSEILTPQDISQHNAIIYEHYKNKPYSWRTKWQGERYELSLGGNIVVNNGDVAMKLALCGKGVTLQPDFIIQPYLDSGELVEILPDLKWPTLNIYLLYPNAKYMSLRIRSFINFLVNYFDDSSCLQTIPEYNKCCDTSPLPELEA